MQQMMRYVDNIFIFKLFGYNSKVLLWVVIMCIESNIIVFNAQFIAFSSTLEDAFRSRVHSIFTANRELSRDITTSAIEVRSF